MTGPSHQGHHVWRHLRGMEVEAKIKKTPWPCPQVLFEGEARRGGVANGSFAKWVSGRWLPGLAFQLESAAPLPAQSVTKRRTGKNPLQRFVTGNKRHGLSAPSQLSDALSQVEVGHTEYGLGLQIENTQFNHEQSQALPPCSLGHKHFTIAVELESCFMLRNATSVQTCVPHSWRFQRLMLHLPAGET